MLSKRADRGVILLLVLLISSILFVIVGRLSWSMALDRALATNHLTDAQTRCDLRSSTALFKAALAQGEKGPITYDLPSGQVEITWNSESGKFNLNSLRGPQGARAAGQLDRLFKTLEAKSQLAVLGLAGEITQFVTTASRDLLALGELMQLDEINEEVLGGDGESTGLSQFLTVYTDGKINPSEASSEVIACLDPGINGKSMTDQVKARLIDPKSKVSTQAANAANRIGKDISPDSQTWMARVTLRGRVRRGEMDVVVRKDGNRFQTVLFKERSETHEQFDQ